MVRPVDRSPRRDLRLIHQHPLHPRRRKTHLSTSPPQHTRPKRVLSNQNLALPTLQTSLNANSPHARIYTQRKRNLGSICVRRLSHNVEALALGRRKVGGEDLRAVGIGRASSDATCEVVVWGSVKEKTLQFEFGELGSEGAVFRDRLAFVSFFSQLLG